MPNLINTDNAGNVFLNYVTPVVQGEIIPLLTNGTLFRSVMEAAYGSIGDLWSTNSVGYRRDASAEGYTVRLPAGGLEPKTTGYRFTFSPWCGHYWYVGNTISSALKMLDFSSSNTAVALTNSQTLGDAALGEGFNTSSFSTYVPFWVINDYAICMAIFQDTSLSTLLAFQYIGWLREPVYTNTTSVRGFTFVSNKSAANLTDKAFRPTAENTTTLTALSSAADSITTPPINCSIATPGADATDITVRDAASPYNPVGKLWNCIQLPATCNVGELWRNVGVDADGGGSEQDVYLCVMPWGTAKLGMRVWTENVN